MKKISISLAILSLIFSLGGNFALAQTSSYLSSTTLSPSTSTINIGGTQQLTVSAKDQYGSTFNGATTTYTSSNPSVATVNSNGLITGVAPGTATITSTSVNGNYTVSSTSTVTVNSTGSGTNNSANLLPVTATINVGGTQQLTVSPKDQNGTSLSGASTTYTSSNSSIATVNSNGLVTGISPGTAIITATSTGSGFTVYGTSTITVGSTSSGNINNSANLTPATVTLNVGGTQQLSVSPINQSGSALTGANTTYTSSTPSVATVSSNGLITGLAAGTTTITATSVSGSTTVSGTSVVTVGGTGTYNNANLTPATVSLNVGGTQQLSVSPLNQSGSALTGANTTYTSSNPSVVTVNNNGLVTAVGPGTATITATSASGSTTVSGTSVVTVGGTGTYNNANLTPATVSLNVGGTQQLSVSPLNQSGSALTGANTTYTSSNPSVVTVNNNGLVTAVGPGTATITATSASGSTTVNGTSTVTVSQQQQQQIPTACSGITFTRTLKMGSRGNDVKCLQALLNLNNSTRVADSGAGSSGNETTYFGPLTKKAVIIFQEVHGGKILEPLGLSSGTGIVGPSTRAEIKRLYNL